jgi:hypothetical protein
MKSLISIFILIVFFGCKSGKNITESEGFKTQNVHVALELKNMNVVYRGISNPIYIGIPHSLSFEASALGLKKIDNVGNYVLSPGSGKTVDILIKATLKDGSAFTEKKTLRIRDIGRIEGTVNNIQCSNSKCQLLFSKEELKHSEIGLNGDNFVFNLDLSVKSFKLKLPNIDTIQVEGNTIPKTINNLIDNLKIDDLIVIFDINPKVNNSNFSSIRICKTPIIQIRITEEL